MKGEKNFVGLTMIGEGGMQTGRPAKEERRGGQEGAICDRGFEQSFCLLYA